MDTTALLPPGCGVQLQSISVTNESIRFTLASTAATVHCPDCAAPTSRVHSRYQRTPANLPAHGKTVHLRLQLRRFRCLNPACRRATFHERLPQFLAPYARKTSRLNGVLQVLAFALGGEAGARVTRRFSVATSLDTLLRRIRQTHLPAPPSPRVVGLDDWAKRKGQAYGTNILDLETHRPIDVLPDATSASVAAWLQQHPQIAFIARDRGPAYRDGATQGAPQVVQIADRFHLLVRRFIHSVDPRHRRERFRRPPLGQRLTWRRKPKGTRACRMNARYA